jgi:hypothetical protein
MAVSQMSAELNWLGVPEFASSATQGTGVLNSLKEIVRLVMRSLWAQHPGTRPAALVEEKVEREPSLDERISRVPELRPPTEPPPSVAVVEQRRAPSEAPPARRVISFAPLWRGRDESVVTSVEENIADGDYPQAVRLAAISIADLLESLPGPSGEGVAAKVALLGLDGRDYLRLSRIVAAPEAVVTLEDALFALHVLIGAHLKAIDL